MNGTEIHRASMRQAIEKFGLPAEIPELVILTMETLQHILDHHDEEFNRERKFVLTIKNPDRFAYFPKKRRLSLYRYLLEDGEIVAMNCVWLKPVAKDEMTYVNTSIVTTEPRNIRKWTRRSFVTYPGGTGEPSSPDGAEASLSSTSGKFLK